VLGHARIGLSKQVKKRPERLATLAQQTGQGKNRKNSIFGLN